MCWKEGSRLGWRVRMASRRWMCWVTLGMAEPVDSRGGEGDRPCRGQIQEHIVYNYRNQDLQLWRSTKHDSTRDSVLQPTLSSLSASLSITSIRFKTAKTALKALVHDSSASVLLGLAVEPPLTLPTSPRADMPILAESLIECPAILSF